MTFIASRSETARNPFARILLMACMLMAGMLVLAPVATTASEIGGTWRTEASDEGHLEVRIAPCGPAICGTILRARDRDGREQPYPHSGRRMIWDMVTDGPGRWIDGRIWDPRNDRTFRSRMELSGTALTVSGCILGICQAQTWQRVD